jgi:predicted 3-demethylubiquinone-9 3-methyltransferase (glyoxalase superfamily)
MSLVQPITPHLWYDKEARAAADFYCSLFPNSGVTSVTTITGTPSGDCDVVSFVLAGHPFMAISAGPHFTFNPSISFMLHFDPRVDIHARENLDATWDKLSDGGKALMDIGEYPFSERYGWVQDRYGLSWQLILARPEGEPRPFIMPSLLFTGEAAGKAQRAGEYWRSVFDGSQAGALVPYPEGSSPDQPGTVMYSDFALDDDWFVAMDSAHEHGFVFNEAISFLVTCRDQAEIDRYWQALSHVPQAEQCGWCKDKFGVAWQITPLLMEEVMQSGDQAKIDRVTEAFLKMKKFDVATLQAASQD